MIWDTFMFNNELDVLEARLYELENIPNLVHVAVEAEVDHQDHPKPFILSDSIERFDQWKNRLIVVRAKGLPTAEQAADPWVREHAQREYTKYGLKDCADSDVILHGDLDEIPREVFARNVNPRGHVAFEMACYSMAVDWLHPEPWRGTVAAKAGNVINFSAMRDMRNKARGLPNAGWHLGWLGGQDAQMRKLNSFCHFEIDARTRDGIEHNYWLEQGWHVDGKKLAPVDVDETWPRWVSEGRCPDTWFRPRNIEPNGWTPPTGRA